MKYKKTFTYFGILSTLVILWLIFVNLTQHNNFILVFFVALCVWWSAYFISFKYHMKHTFVLLVTLAILSIPLGIEVINELLDIIKNGEFNIRNPHSSYLYGISGVLAIIAGLVNKRIPRIILIFIAICSYWFFLQKYVAWSYLHPFNPSDGAAKVFALFFGWLIGLLFFIIPIFGVTHFSSQALRGIKKKCITSASTVTGR